MCKEDTKRDQKPKGQPDYILRPEEEILERQLKRIGEPLTSEELRDDKIIAELKRDFSNGL